jgi:hypothetical protein
MKRYFLLLLILLTACRTTNPVSPTQSPHALPTRISTTPRSTPIPTGAPLNANPTAPYSNTPLPSETFTPVPPSLTISPASFPTRNVTVTITVPPQAQPIQPEVVFHPDGGIYVGDQVSFEVIVQGLDAGNLAGNTVEVKDPQGNSLGKAGFGIYGLGERAEAMLVWAWDTRGLPAGEYPLAFNLAPSGTVWTETVALLPQDALPWPEPQAHWAEAHSQCCVLHYITGTAAERDLPDLLQLADEQARDAVQRMGTDFTAPITVTLLSRMLGHGGFASSEIDVSYLDRNYAGSDFGLVLHHEMIHILDARLGGDFRPSLLVEGLAVYESGGHFKPEPLMPRAAALLPSEAGLGWYIPLAELADNFYLSQHEIGYLEGASLIQYMVNTWGWKAFSSFYRDIHLTQDNLPSSAIDSALQKHFQITFSELEVQFKDALSRITVTNDLRNDMRLTVEFFNAVRRYQQILDPSAFFQTAWLVDAAVMRQRGIVADYLRHPAADENLALETLLATAYTGLAQADYAVVDQVLSAVNAVLDAVQRGNPQPFEVNRQAADAYAIVQAVSQAGYQTQKMTVDQDAAQVWATADEESLIALNVTRTDTGWEINAGAAGQVIRNKDLRWAMLPQILISARQWLDAYR